MSWRELPMRAIYRRVEESGRSDLPLLSVYRDHGVVLREGRDDNFNKASDDLSNYKVVRRGDLVLNKMKTWQGSLGVSDFEGVVSPAYFVGQQVGDADSRYMHHLLRSGQMIAEYAARSKGIRPSQWDLPWDEFASIKVRLPSPRTQRRIADHLDAETARIDALIDKKQRLRARVEERWLADLSLTLNPTPWGAPYVGQLAPGALARGWRLIPLRRLVARSWGGDWGGSPGEREVDLPCVRAADFQFTHLRADQGAPRSFHASSVSGRQMRWGDLVIEKSGGGDGVPVGRVIAWRGDGSAVPTNFAAGLRVEPGADSDFVLLAFRAAYSAGLPWRSIKQTTGLQNLDLNHYLSHLWPIPSLSDQKRIAQDFLTSLSTIRVLQDRLLTQIELLREHRQALITAAVTGALEIPGKA